MGDDGTDREEMERLIALVPNPCVCGHSHPGRAVGSCAKDVAAEKCFDCACLHFVPRGLTFQPLSPDHPLRQRRSSW